ncbi:MAG: hypothetical protein WBX15_17950 [Thermoanaerobaculia bacterium]
MSALTLVASMFFTGFVFGAENPGSSRFRTGLQVTAIEITLEVRDTNGRALRDLTASDFKVLEDGHRVRVLGIEPLVEPAVEEGSPASLNESGVSTAPLNTVIYFDANQLSPYSLWLSTKTLAGVADALTRLGTVQVVWAEPEPVVVVAATRNGGEVRNGIERLAKRPKRPRELIRVRSNFVIDQEDVGSGAYAFSGPASLRARSGGGAILERLVEMAAAEEQLMIQQSRDRMLRFLAGYASAESPRVLLLVNDGYDLDPFEYYSQVLGIDSIRTVRSTLEERSSAKPNEDLSRFLSSSGWIAVPVAFGYLAQESPGSAAYSGHEKMVAFLGNQNVGGGAGAAFFLHPLEPLRSYADATGGDVVTDPRKVPTVVSSLGQRWRLTYQVSRFGDTKLHRVEVRPTRAGLRVDAQKWVGFQPLEELAAARARAALEGRAERGDLDVRARIVSKFKPNAPTVEVLTGFDALDALRPQLRSTTLRFTIAVDDRNGAPVVRTETREGVDLAVNRGLAWDPEIKVGPGARKIAIVVEELSTGAWGTALVDVEN